MKNKMLKTGIPGLDELLKDGLEGGTTTLITGDIRLTDYGISYAADNALLLRFAEVDGKIIRLISCIKKRLGEYKPEIRELTISNTKGIQVGDKLEGFSGLLTGSPIRNT